MIRRQAQLLIEKSNNLQINPQVQNMADAVKYVLSPFEGNINTRYPQDIKKYIKSTKETEKEAEKLYI